MILLDAAVLAYLAYGTWRGARRRLEFELPGLITLAIFFVTGTGAFRWAGKFLEHASALTGQTLGVFSFVGIWVGAFLLVRHFRFRISDWTNRRFNAVQRQRWGMVAGGLRAALLAAILLLVLAHWPLRSLTRGIVKGCATGRILIRTVLPVYEKNHETL